MKKIIGITIILVLLLGFVFGWNFFGPVTKAPAKEFVYIPTGSTYADVVKNLVSNGVISGDFFFNIVAKQAKYPQNVKPGKYEIPEGSSIVALVRTLKRGTQVPVKLVINKFRTKADFAKKIASNFESDSATVSKFLYDADTLKKYGLDTNTVLTAVIPNTYLLKWNQSFGSVFKRLYDEKEKFWTAERRQKAAAHNLTLEQVYIMASIVQEETNKQKDKELIASTYMNRLNKGMKLEADPTVKFAMGDFGLKRILLKHLQYPSAYNTYQHTGLPPGPICTPAISTIDAVLAAPQTNYLFFVAKPDFNGYSNFASTYSEHLVYAKAYQKALDSLILKKAQQQNSNP